MVNFNEILSKKDYLVSACRVAKEFGVELYIVGGYVRDMILNREKSEIDFLVIGNGPEFAHKFAQSLNVNDVIIFKNFGTAHFKYQEIDFEFVGARKESYLKTSRNPIVTTGTFADDISRRDFTINSLAVSLNENNFGELIDTYNGIQDIQDRIIKTPLNPMITFDDDPLRIMRAFRFAAQLNFQIDEELLKAAENLADRLKIVSVERVTDEFLKILMSPKPSVGLILMLKSGIFKVILPELAAMQGTEQRKEYHHKDVFFHTMEVVDNIAPHTDNVWLRFSALVHDIAKPVTKKFDDQVGWTFHGHEEVGARMLKNIFKRLKLPIYQLEYVQKLVRLHLRPIALVDEEVTDSAIRRFVVQAGEDLEDLISLCRADITSKNQEKVEKYLTNYNLVMLKVKEVEEKDKLRAFQSPVRGDEIMAICAITPGKKVGLIKTAIEDAILDGIIPNDYQAALEYLYKIKDEILGN